MIGMGSSSPHLRAASVMILAALVDAAPALVVGLLPRLVDLRHDPWWQVAVANVSVAAGVLWHLREYAGSDAAAAGTPAGAAIASAESVLTGVMGDGRGAGVAVTRVFVSTCARLLTAFPVLRPIFLNAVLELPEDAREAALGVNSCGEIVDAADGDDVLALLGPSGQRISVPACATALPPDAVIATVCDAVLASSLQHLDEGHFSLLLTAALTADLDPRTGHLPPVFSKLANALRDHIFVGLCDPMCCAGALTLLSLLVSRLPSGGGGGLDLLSAPTLQGSLMLLHAPPSGAADPALANAVADFLASTAASSAAAAAAVDELLTAWATRYPALFAESPLRRVSEELQERNN